MRMGIFDTFQLASKVSQLDDQAIRSPWSGTNLHRIVLANLEGVNAPRQVTREMAMKVPAIVKARGILGSFAQSLPMLAYKEDKELDDQPAWLSNSQAGVSPSQRILWTLDDLIFRGGSLWALDRDDDGEIRDAIRIPTSEWDIRDGELHIDGRPISVDSPEIALIEGAQEGLLTIAADTILGALDTDRAWTDRVRSPIPMVELHSTDRTFDLTNEEADELVAEWESARAAGGTAYTPSAIELRIHGKTESDLFIEGRNAIRLDIANFMNVPASLLDGSMATASLTYSTSESKRNEFLEYSLAYWLRPIEARLSRDDIVTPGLRIGFNYAALTDHPLDPANYAAKD